MPAPVWFALSVKQPWAALIVAGVKSVEVRTWGTSRRGPVLIHAARIPDPRPEGWALVPPDLRKLADLGGGIIGVAELVGCVEYHTAEAFTGAVPFHRNAPDWFQPPRLFGFEFRHPRPLPFRPLPGKTFFFPVDGVRVAAPEGKP
jgi:ASCH domain